MGVSVGRRSTRVYLPFWLAIPWGLLVMAGWVIFGIAYGFGWVLFVLPVRLRDNRKLKQQLGASGGPAGH